MDTSFLNKLHTAIKGCKCSVFVYAYANLNVGDDLFIHKLVSSYPDVHFILTAQKPYRQMLAGYRNVTVYETDAFPMSLCKKLRIDAPLRWRISHECDLAVFIGGSIFMEDSRWPNQHQWYRELFDSDRLYFLGCNWGPCRTSRFQESMTAVFAEVKDICFRDRYSYNTFSHLSNVRYAPDILLGLDWSRYRGVEEKKQVLLSVIDCRSKGEELAPHAAEYNRFTGRLAARFAERGCRVVLCSFCEGEGDLTAAEEIRNGLSSEVRECTSVVNYCGTNLDRILRLIAESEYVVASRFHAMILGLVAGKKVLPLIYSEKTSNVLADLRFRGPCLDIRQLPQEPAGLIEEISCGIDDTDRERLSRLAAGHFELLNERLK